MITTVIFDMFETLVSLFSCENYPGRKVMMDLGLSEEEFYPMWRGSEDDRSCGRTTFEDVVEDIMRTHDCYNRELFDRIVSKRKKALTDAYEHLHPEIMPMLKALKDQGIKIGLITNCFMEEREAMMAREMYGLFDVTCLSCELGVMKPDTRIYDICLERLGVKALDCLYVGDGGSHELEAAAGLGMHVAQAVWYLKDGTTQPVQRLSDYINLESPMEVVNLQRALQLSVK